MGARHRILALAVLALASGCATTSVDAPAPAVGMFHGALAGAASAVVLTGGDPEATLYVSVVTVPAGALFGLVTGMKSPARFDHLTVASATGPAVSPEFQGLVREVALRVGRRVRNK